MSNQTSCICARPSSDIPLWSWKSRTIEAQNQVIISVLNIRSIFMYKGLCKSQWRFGGISTSFFLQKKSIGKSLTQRNFKTMKNTELLKGQYNIIFDSWEKLQIILWQCGILWASQKLIIIYTSNYKNVCMGGGRNLWYLMPVLVLPVLVIIHSFAVWSHDAGCIARLSALNLYLKKLLSFAPHSRLEKEKTLPTSPLLVGLQQHHRPLQLRKVVGSKAACGFFFLCQAMVTPGPAPLHTCSLHQM